MGQAKRRGSFAERQALARARNVKLEEEVSLLPSTNPVRAAHAVYGTQKLHTRLLMAGLIASQSIK